MGLLVIKCLVLSLSVVLLSLGSITAPLGASAMGLPPPPPTVNFSIGVQGMVWCKGCRYSGYYAPMDASPLTGAAVVLRCRHGKRAMSLRGVSGAGGYFLIQTAQVASFTSNQCKVYVPQSPVRACSVSANRKGLPLKFQSFVKRGDGLLGLYSVGNFLFRPKYNKCY